ncbi:MAG: metallophosphoesterase [Planctomycetaceae bacterium]
MEWLTALLTPGVLLGNAVLWVALNNRMHARQWPRALVRTLDVVQMLAIPGVTWLWLRWCALLWGGLEIAGVARGPSEGLAGSPIGEGAGEALPGLPWWAWGGVLALQGIAAAGAVSWWRRRWAPVPRQVVGLTRERLDLSSGPGGVTRDSIVRSPFQWIPASELLQVEITTLRVTLPRCPAAWRGLRVVQLSDTHFAGQVPKAYFERVFTLAAEQRPDLVVFTGDLLDHPDRVDWLSATFGQIRAPLGNFYVLGNHDKSHGDVRRTRELLAELGWQDCTGACRLVERGGQLLAIGGSEQPWLGSAPDWTSAPASALRLLVSHTPDQLDAARRGGVDLMLAGHTHGGQVCLPLVGPVFSPSLRGVQYAGGTYWETPTLLHVNRGLSGRSSWRWNCCPELTVLDLRGGA